MFFVFLLALLIALLALSARRAHSDPNACHRCGAPAMIVDDEHPHRRWCGPCYLPIAAERLDDLEDDV